MVIRISPPTAERPIVENDGSQSLQMRTWSKIITDRSIIIGTGSPESVIEATQGSIYMDDAGTAGNIVYIKRDGDIGGDVTQGWILI